MPRAIRKEAPPVVQHTPAKDIRAAMLERYDAMRETIPAAQFRDDNLGFVHKSMAETDWLAFYTTIRENRIAGKVCKSKAKMLDHARWHLRTILLSRKERSKSSQRKTRHTTRGTSHRGRIAA